MLKLGIMLTLANKLALACCYHAIIHIEQFIMHNKVHNMLNFTAWIRMTLLIANMNHNAEIGYYIQVSLYASFILQAPISILENSGYCHLQCCAENNKMKVRNLGISLAINITFL